MNYRYQSNSKKIKEKALILSLAASGMIAFTASFISGVTLPMVLRAVGILAFLLAIMLADAYLFTSYLYTVTALSDREEFEVICIKRNVRRTVCRIYTDEVAAVIPYTKALEKNIPNDISIYKYTAEFSSNNAYLLKIENADGECYIKICADEGLISFFSAK